MFAELITLLNENGRGLNAFRKCADAAKGLAQKNPDYATEFFVLAVYAENFVDFHEDCDSKFTENIDLKTDILDSLPIDTFDKIPFEESVGRSRSRKPIRNCCNTLPYRGKIGSPFLLEAHIVCEHPLWYYQRKCKEKM